MHRRSTPSRTQEQRKFIRERRVLPQQRLQTNRADKTQNGIDSLQQRRDELQRTNRPRAAPRWMQSVVQGSPVLGIPLEIIRLAPPFPISGDARGVPVPVQTRTLHNVHDRSLRTAAEVQPSMTTLLKTTATAITRDANGAVRRVRG